MAIAFVGLLQLHIYSLAISGKAKEINTATQDAGSIMEKIATVDFTSVVNKFANGCCVGACAGGPACSGAADIVTANELILSNENVVVTYPAGTLGDPLGIAVTVSWTGKDGRRHCTGGDAPPVTFSTIDSRTM